MSEDLVNGALAECVVHAATDAFPTSPGIGGAPCVGTAEVEHYLSAVFRPLAATGRASSRADDSAAEATSEILTHRRFCALSRGRASHYREAILGRLATKVRDSAPLEFWYDIGPGYHASLAPGATTGGDVRIGARTAIGIGANVVHGVRIGAEARIGSAPALAALPPARRLDLHRSDGPGPTGRGGGLVVRSAAVGWRSAAGLATPSGAVRC